MELRPRGKGISSKIHSYEVLDQRVVLKSSSLEFIHLTSVLYCLITYWDLYGTITNSWEKSYYKNENKQVELVLIIL